MDSPVVVMHHAQCTDGLGAAWAAWCRYGDQATYIPASYGKPLPETPEGAEVFILDFSFAAPQLEELAARSKSVRLIDHHQSALESLRGPFSENVFVMFDMKRSGARMAWDYFHGTENWLIDYIQDRDLWTWGLPDSREVSAYLQTLPFDVRALDQVYCAGKEAAVEKGRGAYAWMRSFVASAKRNARVERFLGHDVPVVNVMGAATSEVVGELSEGHSFAVGWYETADRVYAYSLRSRGDFDVARLAETMGGGGHPRAAGFMSPMRIRAGFP